MRPHIGSRSRLTNPPRVRRALPPRGKQGHFNDETQHSVTIMRDHCMKATEGWTGATKTDRSSKVSGLRHRGSRANIGALAAGAGCSLGLRRRSIERRNGCIKVGLRSLRRVEAGGSRSAAPRPRVLSRLTFPSTRWSLVRWGRRASHEGVGPSYRAQKRSFRR